MWSRANLKRRAKDCLRKYYWAALAVTFLVGLLGGDGGGRVNLSGLSSIGRVTRTSGYSDFSHVKTDELNIDRLLETSGYSNLSYANTDGVSTGRLPEISGYNNLSYADTGGVSIGRLPEISGYNNLSYVNEDGFNIGRTIETAGYRNLSYARGYRNSISRASIMISVFLAIFAIIVIFGILFKTFVGNVMTVGGCRFFMESREAGRSAGVGRIFYGFSNGQYCKVVKTMFLKDLFITLWTLLLIIPGIIKSYEYYMVSYILSENPEMPYKEVLAMSKEMMDGNKLDTFVLELSFIGWMFLGAILCGIGMFFVVPYVQATMAELYAELRINIGPTGLRGFGAKNEAYY